MHVQQSADGGAMADERVRAAWTDAEKRCQRGGAAADAAAAAIEASVCKPVDRAECPICFDVLKVSLCASTV